PASTVAFSQLVTVCAQFSMMLVLLPLYFGLNGVFEVSRSGETTPPAPEPGPFTSAGCIGKRPGGNGGDGSGAAAENGLGNRAAPRKAAPAGPAGSPGPPLPASWNRPSVLPSACAVAKGWPKDKFRTAAIPCFEPSVAPSVESTLMGWKPSASGRQPITPDGSRWQSCLSPRTRLSFS